MAGTGVPLTLEYLNERLVAMEERIADTRNVVTTKFQEVDTKLGALDEINDTISIGLDDVQKESRQATAENAAKLAATTAKLDALMADVHKKLTWLNDKFNEVRNNGGSTTNEAAKAIAGVSKPPTLGDSNNFSFQDWTHKLKVYSNSLFPGSVPVLQWLAKRTTEVKAITDIPTSVGKDCELEDSTVPCTPSYLGLQMEKPSELSALRTRISTALKLSASSQPGSIRKLLREDTTW